jgi:protease IV
MVQRSNVLFLVLFGAAAVASLFFVVLYLGLVTGDRGIALGNAVAVVDVQGELNYDLDKIEEIERYRDDDNIKAVLLRIDSPGGGVAASQALYHEVLKCREQKPVVAAMASVAASGGYYVACAADSIVAHEGTITGSIGVLAAYLRTEELFHKIGLDVTVIKSGDLKDVGSPYREMTEEEKSYLGGILDKVYDQFVAAVSDGRHLPVERVRELAEGRIYTGDQAVDLGLVDKIGTYEDALLMAARMGGVSGRPRVVRREPHPSLLERFMGRVSRVLPAAAGDERISLKYIVP